MDHYKDVSVGACGESAESILLKKSKEQIRGRSARSTSIARFTGGCGLRSDNSREKESTDPPKVAKAGSPGNFLSWRYVVKTI